MYSRYILLSALLVIGAETYAKTIRQRLRLCYHIMILKETPQLIPPIRIPSSRTRPCKR